MIIDCISDLHGYFPKLEGGDLLIVAGDLTANDRPEQYINFYSWLHKQKYRHNILVAGNHDNIVQKNDALIDILDKTTYLCDSGTEFEGLKIWGSPWTRKFKGQNPNAMAFSLDTEEELAEKWAKMPEGTDILVTHSPLWSWLDRTKQGKQVGSSSLLTKIFEIKPKLHVCGHIHESHGKDYINFCQTTLVNCSHVNEHYDPINPPIRIEL